MITVRDFMETVDYRITEGNDYGWTCYGSNAYSLDSWNGDNDRGHSVSIIFDTTTQTVYEMDVCDYQNQRAYRWINPDYRNFHKTESLDRMIDVNEAWDNVVYVDLEVVDDILEKARAIVTGEDYDTRVSIPINLPEQELMMLFKMAHSRDITFNQLCEEAIRHALQEFEHNPEYLKDLGLPTTESIPHGY